MALLDTSELNLIIEDQDEHHLYAFLTGTIPNYLKIGDTNRPVAIRIAEWREHFSELDWVYSRCASLEDGTYYRDLSVHHYLETILKKHRLQRSDTERPPNVYYSKEFFRDVSLEEIEEAVGDIEHDYSTNGGRYQFYKASHRLTYTPASEGVWRLRANQKEVVEAFKKAKSLGRSNLLMYATMRFGKTFTALSCALEMDAHLVTVVSAKADVADEWSGIISRAENFKDFKYVSSADLKANPICISSLLKGGHRVLVFLTLQDLLGPEIKNRHEDLFGEKIDLLLIDETHFGARAEKLGKVLALADPKPKADTREDDEATLDEVESATKELKATIRIHLSGTPYRILMGSEFAPEDIIAFVQYTDIKEAQRKWDEDNLSSDEPSEEWENDYYGFPTMIRFAFNPNKTTREFLESVSQAGSTYAFSKLFETKSLKKSDSGEHLLFLHENEVLDLFKTIDGTNSDDELLGFLDLQRFKDVNLCKHIVIALPYRASCDALEKLLLSHAEDFKNIVPDKYKIINISGIEDTSSYAKIADIKSAISSYADRGLGTITLTVNRMLTGSTVPEWDTIIYLKDTVSPQAYDQAIFRVQTQYVKTQQSQAGDIIKINLKPQTLVIDLDPNRVFYLQEQRAFVFNANLEKNGNSHLRDRIEKELIFSPIFHTNLGKVVKITPSDIMNYISDYSRDRGVMDEARDLPVDFALLLNESVRSAISAQPEINTRNGISSPLGDGEDSDDLDLSAIEAITKSHPAPTRTGTSKDKTEESLIKKFQTYYARLLFFAFLTEDNVASVEDIIAAVESNPDNKRIATNVGIDVTVLRVFVDKMNPYALTPLDFKIQNLSRLSHDESLAPLDRAINASNKFDRLSDSEVVTPPTVCEQMIGLISDDECREILDSDGILDLASKKGEFALAFFQKLVTKFPERREELAKKIYSIPTSGVAYEFTRKIYNILGLPLENIAEKFNAYDLAKARETKDLGPIVNRLVHIGSLAKLDLNQACKTEDKEMKFGAIVGNPPYQMKDGGAGASAGALYDVFVDLGRAMNPRFASFIIPTRWYLSGKVPDSFRISMLHDKHLKILCDVLTPDDIFPSTNNRGGVCYFLWDRHYDNTQNNLIKVVTIKDGAEIDTVQRPAILFPGEEIFVRDYRAKSIVDKIRAREAFDPMSSYVSGRRPFGIDSSFLKNQTTSQSKSRSCKTKCYIKGQKTIWVREQDIKTGQERKNSWKVFIARANNIGTELADDNLNAFLGEPGEVCSESFMTVGAQSSMTKEKAINLSKYLKTRFCRYLHGVLKISQDATIGSFDYVPMIDLSATSPFDFSKSLDELDEQLFNYYGLNAEERKHIRTMIKPMM